MARTTSRSKHRRLPPPHRRARVAAATLAGGTTALLLTALAVMNSFGVLAAGQNDAPTLTTSPADPDTIGAAGLTPDHLGTLPPPPGLRVGGMTPTTTTGAAPTTPALSRTGTTTENSAIQAGTAVSREQSSVVCPVTPQSTVSGTSTGSAVPTTTAPDTTTPGTTAPTPTGSCGQNRAGHGANTVPTTSTPVPVTPGIGF